MADKHAPELLRDNVALNIQAMEEAIIAERSLITDADGNLLPADVIVNSLKAFPILEKYMKRVRKQLVEHLQKTKEDIRVPGTPRDWITLKETKGREVINATIALPILVLRGTFTTAECNAFLSIRKGDLIKAIRAQAPDGRKDQEERGVLNELRGSKAITQEAPFYKAVVVTKDAEV